MKPQPVAVPKAIQRTAGAFSAKTITNSEAIATRDKIHAPVFKFTMSHFLEYVCV